MRKLVWIGIVLGLAGMPVSANEVDCKTLKSASARLACYDARDKVPTKAEGFGKVQGAITWQYNNFVGTKGDVGAEVILVAKPFEDALKKLSAPEAGLLSLGSPVSGSEKAGIYAVEADGFGNFLIDGVPVGEYEVFVFSHKTVPGPDDYNTNDCRDRYAKYFAGVADYQGLVFKVHKAYCTSISVEKDRTSTISHDFGNTWI